VRLLGYSGPLPEHLTLTTAAAIGNSRNHSRSTSKSGSRRSSKGQMNINNGSNEVLGPDGAPLSPRQAAANELMSLGYADPTVTRFAAMALANLTAAHPSCQDLTVKSGGLAPLVALSSAHIQPPLEDPSELTTTTNSQKGKSVSSPSSSTRGISSSSSSSKALALPESKAPPPPPTRPNAEEESVRYAGLALCNLAAHKQHRVDLVRAGALRPLVLSLAPEAQKRQESRRAAALAFYHVREKIEYNALRLLSKKLNMSFLSSIIFNSASMSLCIFFLNPCFACVRLFLPSFPHHHFIFFASTFAIPWLFSSPAQSQRIPF